MCWWLVPAPPRVIMLGVLLCVANTPRGPRSGLVLFFSSCEFLDILLLLILGLLLDRSPTVLRCVHAPCPQGDWTPSSFSRSESGEQRPATRCGLALLPSSFRFQAFPALQTALSRISTSCPQTAQPGVAHGSSVPRELPPPLQRALGLVCLPRAALCLPAHRRPLSQFPRHFYQTPNPAALETPTSGTWYCKSLSLGPPPVCTGLRTICVLFPQLSGSSAVTDQLCRSSCPDLH